MLSQAKAEKRNVISLEKYRGTLHGKPRGLTHNQVIANPDPPMIRGWIQDGAPKTSLENVTPAMAGQLLFVALSLCIDLALLAQKSAQSIAQGIDTL